jgi:hypothetical protein
MNEIKMSLADGGMQTTPVLAPKHSGKIASFLHARKLWRGFDLKIVVLLGVRLGRGSECILYDGGKLCPTAG